MILKVAFIAGLSAVAAVTALQPVAAQTRSLAAMLAPAAAVEAVADIYGQAIAAALAKEIAAEGDASCRSDRKLDAAAVVRGAAGILVGYGAKLATVQADRPTDAALAAKFDELSGPGSAAALRTLGDERRIADLKRIYGVRFNDALINRAIEMFDRYALIHRLLHRPISPMAGNIELAQVAIERGIKAGEVAKTALGTGADPGRLIELYDGLIDAYEFVLIGEYPAAGADYDVFKGVEEQLQALCLRVGG